MKKHIPNTITCCNLISGCVATVFALFGIPEMALLFIILGAVFDFFDGMTARVLGVSSPIGKELDSLADDVTFGVAPASILFWFLGIIDYPSFLDGWRNVIPFLAYIIAAFSALRLAKFNLDTRQSHSFLGLPAPSNALIWVGIAFIFSCAPVEKVGWLFNNGGLICLAILSLLTNILMISEMPMFSLKFNFKDLTWKSNKIQYIFLTGCILLIIFLLHYSISIIILWYIILSLLTQKQSSTNE